MKDHPVVRVVSHLTDHTDRTRDRHAALGLGDLELSEHADAVFELDDTELDIGNGEIGRERLQGFSAGQAESALQFGQGLQSATFGNTANQNALSMGINAGNYNSQQRQQELAEMFAMRSQPLNEMNAFVSGQQVGMPQFPGFTGATGGQAANIGQAQQQLYSGQMDQFGIQQQQQSQQNQALGSAAAMAAMYAMYVYSDARLKKNIKFVGTIDGVNIYSFDYVWGEKSVGVLAQEVPHATVIAPSGFLMVDYSKVW